VKSSNLLVRFRCTGSQIILTLSLTYGYAFAVVGSPACLFILIKTLHALPAARRKNISFLETIAETKASPYVLTATRRPPQSSDSAFQHRNISVEQTVLEEEGKERQEMTWTEDIESGRTRGLVERKGTAGHRPKLEPV
jgi:hypothetical protein